MSYYIKMGTIPPKRHTQFRQKDGSLYHEQLVSSRGFDGIYTLLYHINAPTQIKKMLEPIPMKTELLTDYPLQPMHLKTSLSERTGGDFLDARVPLLANNDCALSICNPSKYTMDYFYKNGENDEVIYMHDGSGYLYCPQGKLRVKKGDYVVIPRTTVYKMEFDENQVDENGNKVEVRMMITESRAPIETVNRYRNRMGQLLEHSPYCERDIHPPQELITETEKKETLIKTKKGNFLHQHLYDFSPLDVVGWDGCLYPYTLSIYDFEPITGRIHQPPPVHQTFQSEGGFVICSFVPRLFDYHPDAIPAPYNHSNIDSDEVLFYAEGDFMSRKGIDRGSFTIHPGGIVHGPHPGTYEASIGKKDTHEYAVMVDTFKPLYLTRQALDYIDSDYAYSWLE
ncbi:homogentisate 1,2-dioxygenase [Bernardetia sp.]|uniref:homogentisate 1,2-dioxygenase n=1 Tax=Bernardetia sp. TaxID=1937974 RepID=UPI0025BBE00F|nr:homogentisate 1,2-dioxygenase [Bernardetia sp.]